MWSALYIGVERCFDLGGGGGHFHQNIVQSFNVNTISSR